MATVDRFYCMYIHVYMYTPPEVILCETASEQHRQRVADVLLRLLLHVPLLQSVEQSGHHVHLDHHLCIARLLTERGREGEEEREWDKKEVLA